MVAESARPARAPAVKPAEPILRVEHLSVSYYVDAGRARAIDDVSFTLERGMAQVSGLRAVYDLKRPVGKRLVELRIGDKPVEENKKYCVAASSFIGEGGDLYDTFLKMEPLEKGKLLSEIVMDHFREHRNVALPKMGRLVPVNPADRVIRMSN